MRHKWNGLADHAVIGAGSEDAGVCLFSVQIQLLRSMQACASNITATSLSCIIADVRAYNRVRGQISPNSKVTSNN